MIKNIIFDLGNVLINVDFEKFQRNILLEVRDVKLLQKLLTNPVRKKFESGLVSAKQYLDTVVKVLDCNISKKKFIYYYNEMFSEIPEMKGFLIKLSRSDKYRLFLLSNTNPIHFNFVKKKFKYVTLIKKNILSYKLKKAKPDSRIYLTVLSRYHLVPAETLFIDDLEQNCLTAKKLGNAYHSLYQI